MVKRLSPGMKKALKRSGVGGSKHGLWPAVWKKRRREYLASQRKSSSRKRK